MNKLDEMKGEKYTKLRSSYDMKNSDLGINWQYNPV